METNLNPQFDITQAQEIKCEECDNNTFIEVSFIRKVSKFLSPDGNEALIPVKTMACSKCNHVNKEFNPFVNIIDNK